ncbi:NAD(P)H-dependent oxidoreductase [Alteromonas sp. ALT199]|uniref:FMN-dependent NADH-azoreductase n=1 Tax=unclassified Alteromonas TaxID=2614992 RepID=UPI001BEBF0D4|nr:NAD(P)H-dependent oxidoreductase [Alteromonas sp. ALT199]MBT3136227.1 NAD(P)H-dependent oxidoreductase [Alteromonas sp. ALT199]
MKSVLAIFSSLSDEQGNSSKIANEYLSKIESDDSVRINRVDVASLALPHLTGAEMQAWMTEAAERDESQQALAKISDDIVKAVKAADEIVLAVPMYNFGIPSSLKAYFDRIARAGITFKYTETGPIGLLENKTARVFAARGGVYAGSDFDTQTPYLKHFLNFIGISDIKFVYAEGLNMGEEQANKAFAGASEKIIELTNG